MSFVNSNKSLYAILAVITVVLAVLFAKYQSGALVNTSVIQAESDVINAEDQEFTVDQYEITPASLEKMLRASGEPVYYDE